MNTLLLKSILFFALGGALVSGASTTNKSTSSFSFYSDGIIEDSVGVEEKDDDKKEFNSFVNPPCDIAKEEDLDTALSMIAEFQLWQRMVPRYFRVEGNMIHFYPIEVVDSVDLIAIEKFAGLYNIAYDSIHPTRMRAIAELDNLPFSTQNGMARSYFIPREDLLCVLNSGQNAKGDGVRVYLGSKNMNLAHLDLVTSHLLVTYADSSSKKAGAAQKENLLKIYDLTMPCPNACDLSSQLDSVGVDKIIYPELKIKMGK